MQKQKIKNGGDVVVGCKLGVHLLMAGFKEVQMSARYECYPSQAFIGEYLALQLERKGYVQAAEVWRGWSQCEGAMFAQTWVSAVAGKGGTPLRLQGPVEAWLFGCSCHLFCVGAEAMVYFSGRPVLLHWSTVYNE